MNILNLFHKEIIITSDLTIDKIIKTLDNNIEVYDLGRFLKFYPKTDRLFYGQIAHNQFKIIRRIEHKNSWLPTLKGNVFLDDNIVKISIKFDAALSVKIFSYFWITPLLLVLLYAIFTFQFEGLISIIFLAFFAILSLSLFNYEVKKSTEILCELLNGKIEIN